MQQSDDHKLDAYKRVNHRFPQGMIPRSVESEIAVLAGMMNDPDLFDMTVQMVPRKEAFFDTRNQLLFDIMVQLNSGGTEVGPIEIHHIAKQSKVDKDLDAVYIGEVHGSMWIKSNHQRHILIVLERWIERQGITLATEFVSKARDPAFDIFEAIDHHVHLINEMTTFTERRDFLPVSGMIDYLDEAIEGREVGLGIGTPWTDFNNLTGGFQKTDLVFVAARPGMGKTAFMGNVATHCSYNGIGVGIVSLEMPARQLVKRMGASEGRVNSHHVRMNNLDDDEKYRLGKAAQKIATMKLWIDDTPGQTIFEVTMKIRRLKRMNPEVELIFVDYIGLMNDPTAQNREQEIAGMSRTLKNLAKELDICLIVLAQLSRACEGRADKRPILSDLRDSGGQEQDADLVVFLYREEYYNPQLPDWQGIAEALIRKYRHGPTGVVFLTWLGEYTRFENFTGQLPTGMTVEQQEERSAMERLLETEDRDGL